MTAAPTAGPAQWRVPPSTLISTTVSGTMIENVSPAVTYDTNSAWMPPAAPAKPHDSAKRRQLVAERRHAHHLRHVLVVVDREQPGAELRA